MEALALCQRLVLSRMYSCMQLGVVCLYALMRKEPQRKERWFAVVLHHTPLSFALVSFISGVWGSFGAKERLTEPLLTTLEGIVPSEADVDPADAVGCPPALCSLFPLPPRPAR